MVNVIKFKNHQASHVNVIYYPDGQRSIVLDLNYFDNKYHVDIRCSITTFADLELLLAICSACYKEDLVIKDIHFMFLLGMRSDRSFEKGSCNYFRDVIVPIVNILPGRKWFLAPHNYRQIIPILNAQVFRIPTPIPFNSVKIGGDKSAGEVYHFDKIRSQYGSIELTLSSNTINWIHEQGYVDTIYIVDDLVDGGATFIEGSKLLKKYFPEKKLGLFVIHGLFSKGTKIIEDVFDIIYTTNSFRDLKETAKLKVIEVI